MTAASLFSWITSVADRGWEILDHSSGSKRLSASGIDQIRSLCAELLSRKGEATGVALAREVVSLWYELPENAHLELFKMLVEEFSVDEGALREALAEYESNPCENALITLNRATEPSRQELLRRINVAPGGTYAIVKMREALNDHLRRDPALAPLDADMTHLLGSWFNRGFLELRRIDWNTSASILEKLIEHEAVHEINGWEDLRRRLASDRRCFGFFHPAMADEPLIFVEVALTKGIPGSVQSLLQPFDDTLAARDLDTAAFYSISNCQDGLRGISFGNFLIKQVVEDLRHEFPSLKNFVTLSPIPGFTRWLSTTAKSAENPELSQLAEALHARLQNRQQQNELTDELEEPALRLCAYYLLKAKKEGLPHDPVSRFHLRNGAEIERLNWLGDTSEKGIRQSASITVNYLYRTDRIEKNHEAFVGAGRVIASKSVRTFASLPRARAVRSD